MRWILVISWGGLLTGCLGAPASTSAGAGEARDVAPGPDAAPGGRADPGADAAHGAGSDSRTAPDAVPADAAPLDVGVAASLDGDGGDAGASPGDAGLDGGGIPPGCEHLAPLFGAQVRPWTEPCRKCHDMTYRFGQPKLPGPPWWHPTDDAAVVAFLLNEGLVDAEAPTASLFLLYPLAVQDGGVAHPGGDQLFAGTEAYDGFVTFLDAASPCAAAP